MFFYCLYDSVPFVTNRASPTASHLLVIMSFVRFCFLLKGLPRQPHGVGSLGYCNGFLFCYLELFQDSVVLSFWFFVHTSASVFCRYITEQRSLLFLPSPFWLHDTHAPHDTIPNLEPITKRTLIQILGKYRNVDVCTRRGLNDLP